MGVLLLRAGDAVEVCRDEEGLKGAWYPATLIRKRSPQYEVELKSKAREKSKCRVGADEIRPAPPLLVRQHFVADEIVDAHDKDGWWTGTIEKALPDNNYLVHFTHSREEVECHVSQLRLHLDWGDGIWLQPSQLPSEKTVSISPDQPERENAAEEISAAAERVGDGDAAESERSRGKDKVEVEVEDGSSGRGTIGRDVEWGKSHSSAPHANVSSSKQAQVPISQAKLAQVEVETPLNAAANPTLKKSEHSKGARDGKEEMEKAKEDPSDVNVREEERTDKDESSGREEMGKEKNESLQRETMLSFLHTAKLKADTALQADSWMYNELMSLKRKMEKVQQNQDMDCGKLSQMEVQLGNILDKLKDCEQNLCLLIKESGNKMEKVTSSFCVAAASSGKHTNEEIMSPGGPSKRTRQSSRKRAAEAIGGSAADSIQGAAEIGKEPSEMTVSISPEPERENAAEGISAAERVGDAAESERKRRKRSEGKDKAEVDDGSSGRGTMNMNTAGSGRDVEVPKSHSSAPHTNVSSSKQTRVPISQAKLEQVENVLHGEAETTLDAATIPTLKKIELHAFDSVLFFN